MVASDTTSGKVRSVRRYPRAECPEHGMFDEERDGHHATQWDWMFKKCFPNAIREKLRKELTKEDWRAFDEMMHGQRRADWGLLRTWRKKV
jgi:hypothetical protein